jgi:hypothetical protein
VRSGRPALPGKNARDRGPGRAPVNGDLPLPRAPVAGAVVELKQIARLAVSFKRFYLPFYTNYERTFNTTLHQTVENPAGCKWTYFTCDERISKEMAPILNHSGFHRQKIDKNESAFQASSNTKAV